MPANRSSKRSGGRVTPKGVRPPGVTGRQHHGERPAPGHGATRGSQPAAAPKSVVRAPVRSGHRGDR